MDYEEIVKCLQKKDEVSTEIEVTIKNFKTEWRLVMQDYCEAKINYDLAAHDKKVAKMLLDDKIQMLNNLRSEEAEIDSKLQELLQDYAAQQNMKPKQRNSFFKEADELYKEIINILNEFNKEKTQETLRELQESIKKQKQEIVRSKEERDHIEKMLRSLNESTDYDLSNVKIVAGMLQAENMEEGNLKKLEHSVAEMQHKTDELRNDIETLKVKYGI